MEVSLEELMKALKGAIGLPVPYSIGQAMRELQKVLEENGYTGDVKAQCVWCHGRNTEEALISVLEYTKLNSFDAWTVYRCKDCKTVWVEGHVLLERGEEKVHV